MNLMKPAFTSQDVAAIGDATQMLCDLVIASRFDILMLAMGLASYAILYSIRTQRKRMQESNIFSKAHHKEQMLETHQSTIATRDQPSYETLLARHVTKKEHTEVQNVIDSMQIDDSMLPCFLSEEALNTMLTQCICSNDVDMAKLVDQVAKMQGSLSDSTYCLLIQALSRSRQHARATIEEVIDRLGSTFSFDLVLAILGFCRISAPDRPIVDKLLKRLDSNDADIFSEFIHFYLDSNQPEKACDVFEGNFDTFFDYELGEDTQWTLMHAASKCKRQALANLLFETAPFNAAKHVVTIQRWWKRSAADRPNRVERQVGEVFGILARVFDGRYPMGDDNAADSNDESTCFFSDDDRSNDFDSDDDWKCEY